jgi:hypothetical protein
MPGTESSTCQTFGEERPHTLLEEAPSLVPPTSINIDFSPLSLLQKTGLQRAVLFIWCSIVDPPAHIHFLQSVEWRWCKCTGGGVGVGVAAPGTRAAKPLSRLPSGSPNFTANITNFEVYCYFFHIYPFLIRSVQVTLQPLSITSSS